jgi:hypothetical protein
MTTRPPVELPLSPWARSHLTPWFAWERALPFFTDFILFNVEEANDALRSHGDRWRLGGLCSSY